MRRWAVRRSGRRPLSMEWPPSWRVFQRMRQSLRAAARTALPWPRHRVRQRNRCWQKQPRGERRRGLMERAAQVGLALGRRFPANSDGGRAGDHWAGRGEGAVAWPAFARMCWAASPTMSGASSRHGSGSSRDCICSAAIRPPARSADPARGIAPDSGPAACDAPGSSALPGHRPPPGAHSAARPRPGPPATPDPSRPALTPPTRALRPPAGRWPSPPGGCRLPRAGPRSGRASARAPTPGSAQGAGSSAGPAARRRPPGSASALRPRSASPAARPAAHPSCAPSVPGATTPAPSPPSLPSRPTTAPVAAAPPRPGRTAPPSPPARPCAPRPPPRSGPDSARCFMPAGVPFPILSGRQPRMRPKTGARSRACRSLPEEHWPTMAHSRVPPRAGSWTDSKAAPQQSQSCRCGTVSGTPAARADFLPC